MNETKVKKVKTVIEPPAAEVNDNLTDVKNSLLASPLFNLSLSSKELFHSNFLYWIGRRHPVLFREIFTNEKFGCKADWTNDEPESWTVKREHENLDLCLETLSGAISFVLENKVKSIPTKSQLDRYTEKLEKGPRDQILLSLATAFPDRSAIEADGRWRICSYEDLCEAIRQAVGKHESELSDYDKSLMNDYCQFIGNLHQLAKGWAEKIDLCSHSANDDEKKGSPRFLLSEDDKKVCNDLRIGDLQDKIWYSALFERLNDRLRKSGKGFKVISGKDINDIRDEGNCLNEVFTNWGFTHGLGLIEAKVKVTPNYVLLIQLQGKRYCRAIEWVTKKDLGCNGFWKRTQEEALIENLQFFQFDKNVSISYPAICEKAQESISMRKRSGKEGNFCKYGSRFLYQTKNIKDTATVSEVMDAVVKELEDIVDKEKELRDDRRRDHNAKNE